MKLVGREGPGFKSRPRNQTAKGVSTTPFIWRRLFFTFTRIDKINKLHPRARLNNIASRLIRVKLTLIKGASETPASNLGEPATYATHENSHGQERSHRLRCHPRARSLVRALKGFFF